MMKTRRAKTERALGEAMQQCMGDGLVAKREEESLKERLGEARRLVRIAEAGERNENEVDDEFCPFRSTVRIEMEEDCMRTACGPLVADELTALPVGHVASCSCGSHQMQRLSCEKFPLALVHLQS
ncbi:hypothetical protein AAC387_Pa04g1009 [Persea americana]